MSSQIQVVKEKLSQAISQLCETSWMFTKDPARNFTRERKLPLREVISILLCMEGGSLTNELLRYFGCSQHTASGAVVKSSSLRTMKYDESPSNRRADNSMAFAATDCKDPALADRCLRSGPERLWFRRCSVF